MKSYEVTITETLQRKVTIEADSKLDAQEKVEELFNMDAYVLGIDDLDNVKFDAFDAVPEKPKETIRILLVKPNEVPLETQVSRELEDMQALIGGRIEEIMPFDDDVAIICNEEGKRLGLPLNRAIRDERGNIRDIIAGDFFLCNAPLDSERYESLTDPQTEKYKAKFKNPERFIKTVKGIKAIKVNPEREQEAER